MDSYFDSRILQNNHQMYSQSQSQSQSQTQTQTQTQSQSHLIAQRNDAIRTSKGKSVDASVKASWDPKSTEIFIRLIGWNNLIQNFYMATGRKYTRTQLKNRWDAIKKDWGIWSKLMREETGLGWNHERGTVDATTEWWTRKLQETPEGAKFRERGPLLVYEQEILFSDIVATGASAWVPSSGVMPEHMQDEDEPNDSAGLGSDTDTQSIFTGAQTNSQEGPSCGARCRPAPFSAPFPAPISAKKKTKKTTTAGKIAKCLERLVDSIENGGSTSNSENSTGQSIQACLDMLEKMPEIEQGSRLWMYATRLFLKPSIRQLFLRMKRDETRRMLFQDQMERDMQRRATSFVSPQASHGESRASSG
ncbi:hypothetical protein ACJIZ3_023841 [Penstemon smallii]|uniref:Myb/SANT-like domain-containing protein n=1 Tax=Penstemon smallii TaxID=265156 RepID=A0ABD3TR89_9LAMI